MLPREVDPLVHNMSTESPGEIKYSEIGGLAEQICELRGKMVVSSMVTTKFHGFLLTQCEFNVHLCGFWSFYFVTIQLAACMV